MDLTTYSDKDGYVEIVDNIAVESPLEVLVNGKKKFLCMRMPGMDKELAAGICCNSGLVESPDDIKKVSIIDENKVDIQAENIRDSRGDEIEIIRSSSGVIPDSEKMNRSNTCQGRAGQVFSEKMLFAMQSDFFFRQKVFNKTGATHGAALYDIEGALLAFAEDVGRHNALDKCTGSIVLNGKHGKAFFCMLSSRLSYEMVIKGFKSGVSVIAGVSAPTSLAVSVARERGITLAGFLRGNRFNIYAGEWRLSKN